MQQIQDSWKSKSDQSSTKSEFLVRIAEDERMTGKLYTCRALEESSCAATVAVPNPRKEQRKRFLAQRRRWEGGPKRGRWGAGQWWSEGHQTRLVHRACERTSYCWFSYAAFRADLAVGLGRSGSRSITAAIVDAWTISETTSLLALFIKRAR